MARLSSPHTQHRACRQIGRKPSGPGNPTLGLSGPFQEKCANPCRGRHPHRRGSESARDDAEGQQGQKQRQSSPTASTTARGHQGPARARSLIPASVWVLGCPPYRTDGLMAAPLTVHPGHACATSRTGKPRGQKGGRQVPAAGGGEGSALLGFSGMRECSGTRER